LLESIVIFFIVFFYAGEKRRMDLSFALSESQRSIAFG